MDSNGIQRISIDFKRFQLTSVDLSGLHWISKDFNGFHRISGFHWFRAHMLTQCCLNPMVLRMCMCDAGCAGPMAIPMECTWATKRARWRSRGGTSARASDKKTNPHMCSRIQCVHREKTDRYRAPVSAKKKSPRHFEQRHVTRTPPPKFNVEGSRLRKEVCQHILLQH